MSSLYVFIISWIGKHENAVSIARQCLSAAKKVIIVYSDPNPELVLDAPCEMIRRPNELFWSDKFKTCIDVCEDNSMMVIHADCGCEDWSFVIKNYINALSQYENIGVWAPKIIGTYFDLTVSRIGKISNSNLNIVALTDGIVFALSPVIIKRMRNISYDNNTLGWGIDFLFCAASHVMNQLVTVDESVTVIHPSDRGYDAATATKEMNEFLNQLSTRERVECELLRAYVNLKHIENRSKSNGLS